MEIFNVIMAYLVIGLFATQYSMTSKAVQTVLSAKGILNVDIFNTSIHKIAFVMTMFYYIIYYITLYIILSINAITSSCRYLCQLPSAGICSLHICIHVGVADISQHAPVA